MKNEDLYVYKKSDFYEDFISSQKEYYEREQVDALLSEKDREIALLKERICNGDVSRLTWIDDCIAKDKEIAELKAALERDFVAKKSAEKVLRDLLDCGLIKEWFYNGTFHAVLKADDPHLQIAELKKKLMPCLNGDCILTCEVVEKYGKENAELKQKLEDVQASAYADSVDAGMRERRLRRALYKACANWAHHRVFVRFKTNEKAWENVERKCLKKAKEYK